MSALSQAQRKKGDAFLSEASSTLSKSTWFASSTERKYEDAAESYVKAANAYKVGGCHDEAGSAYQKAAELYKDKLKSLGEASKCLSDAGACLKKTHPTEAVGCYRSAVTLLCDAGRLNQAAKLSKEIAEIFENDGAATAGDDADNTDSVTAAIASYQQAAELFEMEQAKSQASQCLQKVAELSSGALNPPELLRAAEIYENLGRQCLESNLLKYNAKSHFLNGVMCHLANHDSIGASQALSRFDNLDYTFGESREGKFAQQLVETVEGFDPEGFATACFEYDRISKLDPWKTSMLVRVKRGIEEEGGGGEGEDDLDLT
jgi:alpha-soluble NSF attachment protein